jgi:pimeloyl-[acyl-carrier protein] methyl ester esterase
MSQVVFLPGFDGEARLRGDFLEALARRNEVRAVSYPQSVLGSLDQYLVHAMGQAPVDWNPVLVAESFSGLVAARWASLDARVRALVLCGSFARNPVGHAASLGASWPSLAKLGPAFFGLIARASDDPARSRWAADLARSLEALPGKVVAERLRIIAAEDVGAALGSLRIPVVIVQFDADVVIGRLAREHLESVCHNAHVLRLPGPHFALEMLPAQCAEAIDTHLRSLFPARA